MRFIVATFILVTLIGMVKLIYQVPLKSIDRSPSAIEVGPIPGDDQDANVFDPNTWPPDVPSKDLIDMHVHFACLSEKNGCYVSPDFQKNWKMGVYLSSLEVSRQDLTRFGDEIVIKRLSDRIENSKYIKKSVVLALDGIYDHKSGALDKARTQVLFSNQFLLREISKYKNILFGASINPFKKNALEELEWAQENGAVLVKWIPCIMDFNPSDNDPRLDAFYKKLKELNLPLLSHTGNESTFLWSKNELCNPSFLRKPLKMGVTVIGGHMSSDGSFFDPELNKTRKGFDIVSDLMKDYDNFYVDISAVTQINRFNHIQKAIPFIEECMAERKNENFQNKHSCRVLYGSDWPLIAVELGLPLVSWQYYRLHISDQWKVFIPMLDSVFDRDVALKKALGIPDKIFKDTVDFFEKRP